MNKFSIYQPSDKMSDLIGDNFSLLMMMSRFGISLGFGDKSVQEVCKTWKVDCPTFLAVANFMNGKHQEKRLSRQSSGRTIPMNTESYGKLSLSALMDYLKRAHTYYLEFMLPSIRRKLIEAIDCSGRDEAAMLILKFYDAYVLEVHRHMEYENQSVFTYVERLLQGRLTPDFEIAAFAGNHHSMEEKLKELKNILVKYYPEKGNNNLLNAVLFDIFNCEEDLVLHCQVEDQLFVPAVAHLEQQMKRQQNGDTDTVDSIRNHPKEERVAEETDVLSQREKEVIACVVRGMTNKAIADELFISLHTVLTHRRNIARKLQIHSPAGLTIYAIVNKLVEIEDIKNIL